MPWPLCILRPFSWEWRYLFHTLFSFPLLINPTFLGTWDGAQSLRRVWLFVTPWSAAHQAPLSVGISQARILERAGISLSRDHPDSGIEAASLAPPLLAGRCFTGEPPVEPHLSHLGSPICDSSYLPNQAKPSPGLGLPDSEPQVCQISSHCSGSVTLTQFFLELKHTGYLTFWVT